MKKYVFILVLIAFTACKTQIIPNFESSSYFYENDIMDNRNVHKNNTVLYFIRHAQAKEKNSYDDPSLSLKGKEKVKKYISYFKDKRLDSVFSTSFNRASQTGKSIANSKKIGFEYYNPNTLNERDWVKRNKGKAILFIGHSNTCPEMVNRFIGRMRFTQVMDDNYSDIYRVIISKDEIYADILTLEDEIRSREVLAKQ
ncbi:MAG: histidine phosphatase family protein [Flavobacteriaceae bacterium]